MGESNSTHWRLEEDEDQILWLCLDKADSSTNVLSKEVLEELEAVVDQLSSKNAPGLIIHSAKKNGFLAGADITEFTELKTTDAAFDKLRYGQTVFNKIEKPALSYRRADSRLLFGWRNGAGPGLHLSRR